MTNFQKMSLRPELLQALKKMKFVEATSIQAKVLPILMESKDLIATAETGSGKTAAYSIPMVERLLKSKATKALVLAPTRELAFQIADFIRELIVFDESLDVVSLVGGADIRKQLRSLNKNPRILVATPGRLSDHIKRKSIQLEKVEYLVLDEGDRMLDMGFSDQINFIFKHLPKVKQSALFSATMTDKVKKLSNKYLSKPEIVSVGQVSRPVSSIKQSLVELKAKEKENRILDELNQRRGSIIVFTKTQASTDQLAKFLKSYAYPVDLIHGGRTQGQRNRAIQGLKSGKIKILCATDIAARGIDVPQVEHVINFDLPREDEDYIHRIGRTARNGAKGEALSFVTPEDATRWERLIKKYEIKGLELSGVAKKKPMKKRDQIARDYIYKKKKKTKQRQVRK